MIAWEPLEPGVHEHEQGTAYIDQNYIPAFGWSMSLRDMVEGGPAAKPFEFRLCRATERVVVEMTPDRIDALGDIVEFAEGCVNDEEIATWIAPARLGVLERNLRALRAMLVEAQGQSLAK